ncbi:MAG: hypothetical protein M1339_08330 [Bacteroidetes bacterium]|nr:hypothetical protein [Bacteroidota bacterium]
MSTFVTTLLYMFAAVLLTIVLLRSAYSLALFGSVTKEMQMNGWKITPESPVIELHEQTTYEASYLFFKIGTTTFHLVEKTLCNGTPTFRIVARIDSYTGVPFVNFHGFYETDADAKTLMCLHTFNRRIENRSRFITSYHFDFPRKEFRWSEVQRDRVIRNEIMQMDTTHKDIKRNGWIPPISD